VAPVMNEEGRCLVYLPPGTWYDWWTGERLQGPQHLRLQVPLERLPLYVRGESLLVTGPEMEYVGQREWRPLTVDLRLSVGGETTVWSPEQPALVAGQVSSSEVRLRVAGPLWDYRIRFVEPAVALEMHAEGDASGLVVRQEDDVTVAGMRGGEFEIRARLR
jgi:hypothetical protein